MTRDVATDSSKALRRFERATKLSGAELKRLVSAAQRAVEAGLPEDEPDYTAPWVYEEAIQVGWRAAILVAMGAGAVSQYPAPRLRTGNPRRR